MRAEYGADVIHELIQKIYLAGADPRRWPEFLEALRGHTDGGPALIGFFDRENPTGSISASVGFPDGALELYHRRFVHLDPFLQSSEARAPMHPGFIGLSQDLITEEALEQTEFYREFGKHSGTIGGILCFVFADGPVVAGVGVHRRPGKFFGQAEVALFRMLFPHLRTAMQIHRELSQEAEIGRAALSTMNRLSFPAIICDAESRVLFMNSPARDRARGFVADDRIDLGTPQVTRRLRDAIGNAATSGADLTVRVEFNGHGPTTVVIAPVPEYDLLRLARPMVAVLVYDAAEAEDKCVSRAAEKYQLTPVETRVLATLLQGLSVRELAVRLGITYESARTHIKRVLSKTTTRRQAELVRLVLTSVVE